MSIKNSKSQIRLPLFLAIAIAAGILIGANMADKSSSASDLVNSIYKFREILNYIEKNYVDEVQTDDLVESAITDMLKKLDPHTVYIPAEDQQYSESQLEGNFEGIGIEYNIFKDTIYVVTPLSGGPSERVGLLIGDKIIRVDEEVVAGIGINNRGVIDRLRGPKGSKVSVAVMRKKVDEILIFNIVRDKIPQFSVDVSYMIDEEIGYLKISRFSATTYDEFKSSMQGLLDQGMKKLVLDLTGNPGGYLDMAIKISDEFLAGDPMIVFTKSKEYRYNQEHRAKREGLFENQPVIVLIDEGSASASEIVSGALQDHDRALIVGRRSFGKGLVQSRLMLTDGSELRLTISRYYTPSGRSIQRPYDNGQEDYYNDIYKRYTSGEVYDVNKMEINDSLKFTTTNGRTVYGGGGILPDYFVSIDTVGNSRYLNRLFTTNAIREYALTYTNANKEKLENIGMVAFAKSFEISDQMLSDLADVAESNHLKFDEPQFEKSKILIKTFLKAQIARGIWNNDGFYPIFNQTNEILNEALELFDEAEVLAAQG